MTDQAPINVVKFGATVQVSEEMAFEARALFNARYQRRHTKAYQPAPPEAWERYRAAVAGLAAFEAYEGSQYGGPDYGNEVPPPEPTITIDYLETRDEWLTRCRALDTEGRAFAEQTWAEAAGQWSGRRAGRKA
jgi:hypothetical protein